MSLVDSKLVRSLAAVAAAASFVLAGCSELVSRDDFTQRVQNKSDKEVAKAVGKPEAVAETSPDQVTWTYNGRTFNIQDGNKFDTKAVVVFSKAGDKLTVTDVRFE